MERKNVLIIVACAPALVFAASRIVPFITVQGITDRWVSNDPPVVAAPAATSVPDAGTPASMPGDESSAEWARLEAALSEETVAADPVESVRRCAIFARTHPATVGAGKANAFLGNIRSRHAARLEAADRISIAEVASATASADARLGRLEHQELADELRALETRHAGLAGAEQAASERERVEEAWGNVPRAEKDAARALKALGGPPDDASVLDYAEKAQALVARHGGTRSAHEAEERRDAALARYVKALEATLRRDPDDCAARANAFPATLAGTVAALRVTGLLRELQADRERAEAKQVAAVRALRQGGELEKALEAASSLKASKAREVAAIEAVRAATERVDVPAGSYTVGPEDATKTVEVLAFQIARGEATSRIYAVFVFETGARAPSVWEGNATPTEESDLDLPVAGVSLAEAKAFAAWLGARLPTAVEWECAARGTDSRPYPWGPTWDKGALHWSDIGRAPPGKYPRGASPFGALDMAGNVAEWTTTLDARGQAAVKGGSYKDLSEEAFRADAVRWTAPDRREPTIGIRCVWDGK